MKKKLMFILLLSTPILGAQNSILNPNSSFLAQATGGQLKAVPKTTETWNVLPWPDENSSTFDDNDEFSSLVLSRQLAQLNQYTPFQVVHHPTLERYIRVFLEQQRSRLENVMGRSSYYFPVIEKYLDQNDLPMELKYLAIVESALNPTAVSSAGAKGMWQFMYGTGKEYGLHIDSYVDERLDFDRSTRAACAYLKKLYGMFGSWDLALAAYNSGPGNVKKAIQRSGGNKDYWAIRKYLPIETRGYLPSFYATMYLFEYNQFHNIQAGKSEMTMVPTDTVLIKRPLDLSALARELKLEPQFLHQLNAQYKKQWIPASREKAFSLTLPEQKVPEFIAIEEKIHLLSKGNSEQLGSDSFIPINSENSYLVQKGDNLNSIAKKHRISVTQLKQWNGLETEYLIAGQRLVVRDHVDSLEEKNAEREQKVRKKEKRPDHYDTYRVKPGDTLFRISRLFDNVSIAEIRHWNDLDGINHLQPGMVLKIVRTN